MEIFKPVRSTERFINPTDILLSYDISLGKFTVNSRLQILLCISLLLLKLNFFFFYVGILKTGN